MASQNHLDISPLRSRRSPSSSSRAPILKDVKFTPRELIPPIYEGVIPIFDPLLREIRRADASEIVAIEILKHFRVESLSDLSSKTSVVLPGIKLAPPSEKYDIIFLEDLSHKDLLEPSPKRPRTTNEFRQRLTPNGIAIVQVRFPEPLLEHLAELQFKSKVWNETPLLTYHKRITEHPDAPQERALIFIRHVPVFDFEAQLRARYPTIQSVEADATIAALLGVPNTISAITLGFFRAGVWNITPTRSTVNYGVRSLNRCVEEFIRQSFDAQATDPNMRIPPSREIEKRFNISQKRVRSIIHTFPEPLRTQYRAAMRTQAGTNEVSAKKRRACLAALEEQRRFIEKGLHDKVTTLSELSLRLSVSMTTLKEIARLAWSDATRKNHSIIIRAQQGVRQLSVGEQQRRLRVHTALRSLLASPQGSGQADGEEALQKLMRAAKVWKKRLVRATIRDSFDTAAQEILTRRLFPRELRARDLLKSMTDSLQALEKGQIRLVPSLTELQGTHRLSESAFYKIIEVLPADVVRAYRAQTRRQNSRNASFLERESAAIRIINAERVQIERNPSHSPLSPPQIAADAGINSRLVSKLVKRLWPAELRKEYLARIRRRGLVKATTERGAKRDATLMRLLKDEVARLKRGEPLQFSNRLTICKHFGIGTLRFNTVLASMHPQKDRRALINAWAAGKRKKRTRVTSKA